MKTPKIIVAALVITGMASSCGNNAGEDETTPESYVLQRFTEAAVFSLENSAEVFSSDSDLQILCRADLLMPSALGLADSETLCKAIDSVAFSNGYGTDSIAPFFLAQASGFGFPATLLQMSREQQQAIAQNSDSLTDYDGFCEVEGTVSTLTPRLLTYCITTSKYAPRAAHGDYSVEYINYDLVRNRIITLESIFTEEGLRQLPSRIQRRARQLLPLVGQTVIRELPEDGNFCLTQDDRIIFVYQPMEVASYSQGVIGIPFDLFHLAPLMTDEAKEIFGF